MKIAEVTGRRVEDGVYTFQNAVARMRRLLTEVELSPPTIDYENYYLEDLFDHLMTKETVID